MLFECCKGCVSPKRYPGCHASCPEYLKDKAISDVRRTRRLQESAKFGGAYDQTQRNIRNAVRSHGRKAK